MFVKPASGRSVRWPGTLRLLDTAGATVPATAFWLRALSRGDVLEVSPPQALSPAAEKFTAPEGKSA
ncbi:DUF2635 domain-containing protein [Acetobacter sp. TBRC 12305]|uniref:DUF2635 domain-containing protein n=1 Tax=Acetobacter garciniae TaxID=2817435 RepID=A0A939HPF0_9PROT|nr:DUF2635 domain-containing protein [Acetobacter garciniae]MBO1325312.1 DUF2635 domain-containing protein [Acetobacter garciniae]MBX0344716.1 DUF2635 domain-containing protein [Acetobacter garciniae]